MKRYLLQSHVHICTPRNMAILLDLRRDEYIGLSAQQLSAVGPLIRGLQSSRALAPGSELDMDSHAAAIADRLVERGLLTLDEKSGHEVAPITLPAPDASLAVKFAGTPISVRITDVFAFLAAWVAASLSLKTLPLDLVVRRCQRRAVEGRRVRDDDFREIVRMTLIWRKLRSFVYTARDHCLLDSLVLVYFLARYKLYPTWVIGVRPNPFGAHSWVQHQQLVLNGAAPHVQRFTPILAV